MLTYAAVARIYIQRYLCALYLYLSVYLYIFRGAVSISICLSVYLYYIFRGICACIFINIYTCIYMYIHIYLCMYSACSCGMKRYLVLVVVRLEQAYVSIRQHTSATSAYLVLVIVQLNDVLLPLELFLCDKNESVAAQISSHSTTWTSARFMPTASMKALVAPLDYEQTYNADFFLSLSLSLFLLCR